MLNITKKQEGGCTEIALEGRLDTVTAPELEEELKKTYPGTSELIIDFEKLEYISSAGLRVLLSAHKVMNGQGTLKIRRINETVQEIFEVTGFSDILTVE